jgi:prevent-host-death family protein
MEKKVTTVNIAEAKARLPELVRRAGAGEEILIARDHRPVARLVPLEEAGPRRPGSARGRVRMAADFDATPPDFDDYLR